ncbi:MAG: hypothetical protein JWP81_823 [Ferruginibacter sp.]|nr:hypothetical protein [Ferruginibacter sp.]
MENELKFVQEDVSGTLTVKMANGQTLDDFCSQYIPDYNRDRFEALAIRVFVGGETIITIYAVDKLRQDGSTFSEGKIPVKKFKLSTVPLSALFSYCEAFNCTLSTENYPLDEMEIINK